VDIVRVGFSPKKKKIWGKGQKTGKQPRNKKNKNFSRQEEGGKERREKIKESWGFLRAPPAPKSQKASGGTRV